MPFVQISLVAGRPAPVKRELIAAVTDAVTGALSVEPAQVRVVLQEVPASHWGIGGRTKDDEA